MDADHAETVLLIATLDTKGEEAAYLRDRIRRCGKKVLVMDVGMRGSPNHCAPDIGREHVVQAADTSYEQLLREPRHRAEDLMIVGAARIVQALFEQGRVNAVIGLGGFDGSLIATGAMRALPVGVPKLVVSAAACGHIRFGEYVGTKDVMILPSVVDMLGLNEVLCKILDNAAGAITGMLDAGVRPLITGKNMVAATVYGQTTPAANYGKPILEAAGYRMVAFHPNGVGGAAMEELIRRGAFCGVWDLTPQELTDQIVMQRPAGGETRLEAAIDLGVPQVVVPGCVDFIWDSPDLAGERFAGRLSYLFNRSVLLVKVSLDEVRKVAQLMARKLNRSKGQLVVMLPLKGISMFDVPGGPLHQPEVNDALFTELRLRLNPTIPLIEMDAHVNDPEFASTCATKLIELISSTTRTGAEVRAMRAAQTREDVSIQRATEEKHG